MAVTEEWKLVDDQEDSPLAIPLRQLVSRQYRPLKCEDEHLLREQAVFMPCQHGHIEYDDHAIETQLRENA